MPSVLADKDAEHKGPHVLDVEVSQNVGAKASIMQLGSVAMNERRVIDDLISLSKLFNNRMIGLQCSFDKANVGGFNNQAWVLLHGC